jgi:hypothetical protein
MGEYGFRVWRGAHAAVSPHPLRRLLPIPRATRPSRKRGRCASFKDHPFSVAPRVQKPYSSESHPTNPFSGLRAWVGWCVGCAGTDIDALAVDSASNNVALNQLGERFSCTVCEMDGTISHPAIDTRMSTGAYDVMVRCLPPARSRDSVRRRRMEVSGRLTTGPRSGTSSWV